MTADPLRIGILNLMHDKVDTQLRFTKVLSEGPTMLMYNTFTLKHTILLALSLTLFKRFPNL